jgi:hypothetical protein
VTQTGFIFERVLLGCRLEKEVKRVVDRHFGDQVHRDLEFGGALWKDEAREVVGKWIELPVDEVLLRLDTQGIRQYRRAAVRRRAQAHDLWRQADPTVVLVVRDVIQGDMDRHGCCSLCSCLPAQPGARADVLMQVSGDPLAPRPARSRVNRVRH